MNRVCCVSLFLLLILGGCQSSNHKELNQKEMTDLMVDIMLSDEIVRLYPPQERDSIRNILTQSLLKIHNLDRSELDTNLYLYMKDFERFDKTIELLTIRTKNMQQSHKEKPNNR